MSAPLALDQLQTFIAIADSGSFTRAADAVNKTQSAVSMQMRRLEERVSKALFERDGRTNKLTEDGERLHGNSRLSLVDRISRSGEAATVGNGDKCLQLVKSKRRTHGFAPGRFNPSLLLNVYMKNIRLNNQFLWIILRMFRRRLC
jgi:hypothetical protein